MDVIRTLFVLSFAAVVAAPGFAQTAGPTTSLSGFQVRTVVSGLNRPTTMAFLGEDDFLVLEKDSGKIIRFRNGLRSEVLDLAVNNASERGLLGIALHPRFASDRGVYLF